jgi:phage tail-like protein
MSVAPQTAFYFRVQFPDDQGIPDTSFQEISGISTEINTEKIEEGGENRFAHTVPKGTTHKNLVLKRGIVDLESKLTTWVKDILEGDLGTIITPKTIQVQLLNNKGQPAMTWTIHNAYPVKWSVDDFNSTKNALVVETIEFSYSYSIRN